MATETCECEVWVLVDAAGDYAVGQTAAEATEAYEANVQALADCEGYRLVKAKLSVPLPAAVELAATVPAVGAATLEVSRA